jgi:hypothetical protein
METTWFSSSPLFHDKLLAVQKDSDTFNKEVFGDVFRQKRHLEGRIRGIQCRLGSFPSESALRLERQLQMEYRDILLREELLWFQKSRENWLVHGNRNTKFFHAQTIVRRHRNKIAGIFVDDTWCSDNAVMQREAIKFFKSLLLLSRRS